MKNKLMFLIIVCLVIASTVGLLYTQNMREADSTSSPDANPVNNDQSETATIEQTIPDSKTIDVPYTVQAPYANWNIHEESCEEAALLMYHYYLRGTLTFDDKSVIPPQTAHDEMLKMKSWQKQHYGYEPDLTLEKWGVFARNYYGYQATTSKATEAGIKKQIAQGHPVVVPVMTHALENPHYGRQTTYHYLLIKGYNAKGVITNDAGVKGGEDYFYTWEVLFQAIDAQTPTMKQGRVMAILER